MVAVVFGSLFGACGVPEPFFMTERACDALCRSWRIRSRWSRQVIASTMYGLLVGLEFALLAAGLVLLRSVNGRATAGLITLGIFLGLNVRFFWHMVKVRKGITPMQ